MELFTKDRRGIYVYYKHPRDIEKLEKYGNIISCSKRGRYACIYMDDNKIDKSVEELKKKKFVKKIVISSLVDLSLKFERLEKN